MAVDEADRGVVDNESSDDGSLGKEEANERQNEDRFEKDDAIELTLFPYMPAIPRFTVVIAMSLRLRVSAFLTKMQVKSPTRF